VLIYSEIKSTDERGCMGVQAPEGGKMSKKTYDLDSKDFFWAKNAQHPFPQVAEEIDIELNKYVAFRISRKGRETGLKLTSGEKQV